jgi:hypothetical protein
MSRTTSNRSQPSRRYRRYTALQRAVRGLFDRVKKLRYAGAAAPHAGETGWALAPTMQGSSQTAGAHPE